MKVDDILKLIDAGYTKADIDAMNAEPAQTAEPAERAPAAEPEQTAEPEKAPAEESILPKPPASVNDQILEALDRLTNTLIKSNINSTVIQPAERTPEDALAEIISPTKPKARR